MNSAVKYFMLISRRGNLEWLASMRVKQLDTLMAAFRFLRGEKENERKMRLKSSIMLTVRTHDIYIRWIFSVFPEELQKKKKDFER